MIRATPLLVCLVLLAAFAAASQPIAVDVHRDSIYAATTHAIELATGDESSLFASVGSDLSIRSIRATCDGLFVLFHTTDSLDSTMIARVIEGEVQPVLTSASGLLSSPTSFVVDPMAKQILFTAASATYGGLGIFSVPYDDADAHVATEMLVPQHARATAISNLELHGDVLFFRLEMTRGESAVMSYDREAGSSAMVGGDATGLISAFRIDEDGDVWAQGEDGSFFRCSLGDGCEDVAQLRLSERLRDVVDFAVTADAQLLVAGREGAVVVDATPFRSYAPPRRSPSASQSLVANVTIPAVNSTSASVTVSATNLPLPSANATVSPQFPSNATRSPSPTASRTISVSETTPPSVSASVSLSASKSQSAVPSESPSTTVSASKSVSATVSASLSVAPSQDAPASSSRSVSASVSKSSPAANSTAASSSASASASKSVSGSHSASGSASVSISNSRSIFPSFNGTQTQLPSRSVNATVLPVPSGWSASYTPIITPSNSKFLKQNETSEDDNGPTISSQGWELIGMFGVIGICLLCIMLLCCWRRSVTNEMAMSLRLPDSPDDFL